MANGYEDRTRDQLLAALVVLNLDLERHGAAPLCSFEAAVAMDDDLDLRHVVHGTASHLATLVAALGEAR